MADISVIIPAHNSDQTIADSIESIFAQTLKPKEIVVIDDGSNDSTHDVIEASIKKSPSDIRILYKRRENRGIGATLEELVRCSSSAIVARMDADDISAPNRLASQYEKIRDGFDIVGSNINLFGSRSGRVFYPPNQRDIDYAILSRCPFCHPAIMAKTSKLKYCDERLEDYKLWLRLWSENDVKWCNIQSFLLSYRTSDTQASAADRQEYQFDPSDYIRNLKFRHQPLPTVHGLRFTARHQIKKLLARYV